MIREATDLPNIPANGHIAKRRIQPEEADAMKAKPGTWFDIDVTEAEPSSVTVFQFRLKKQLPLWYGGEWEVRTAKGRLLVRFLGQQSKAA